MFENVENMLERLEKNDGCCWVTDKLGNTGDMKFVEVFLQVTQTQFGGCKFGKEGS